MYKCKTKSYAQGREDRSFLFQAEDGIRGSVASSGLGDVYRRHVVVRILVCGSDKRGVVVRILACGSDKRGVPVW